MDRFQTTTYHDVHEPDRRDPQFKAMVDLMVQFIVRDKYTPGEMRDAAFMASLQFDSMYRHTEHRYVFKDPEQDWPNNITEHVDRLGMPLPPKL